MRCWIVPIVPLGVLVMMLRVVGVVVVVLFLLGQEGLLAVVLAAFGAHSFPAVFSHLGPSGVSACR